MKKAEMIQTMLSNTKLLRELLTRVKVLENKLINQNGSDKIIDNVDAYYLTNVEKEQIELLENGYLNHISKNKVAKDIVIYIMRMLVLERRNKSEREII